MGRALIGIGLILSFPLLFLFFKVIAIVIGIILLIVGAVVLGVESGIDFFDRLEDKELENEIIRKWNGR